MVDPLDTDLLAAAMQSVLVGADADPIWRPPVVVARTGSTNADLVAAARRGEAAGAVLVADHQVAGRGRLGRTWAVPAGSAISMSVLLRPDRDRADWGWLPLIAGLAVSNALRRAADVDALLKWPNDVLVDGAKLCGILAELVETPTGPACVLGIGVNVHASAAELPAPTAASLPPTSLALLRPGTSLARADLVAAILKELAQVYRSWQAGADIRLRAEYLDRSATIGRVVAVQQGGGVNLTGRAIGLDLDGQLRVETASRTVAIAAGDVIHLR